MPYVLLSNYHQHQLLPRGHRVPRGTDSVPGTEVQPPVLLWILFRHHLCQTHEKLDDTLLTTINQLYIRMLNFITNSLKKTLFGLYVSNNFRHHKDERKVVTFYLLFGKFFLDERKEKKPC